MAAARVACGAGRQDRTRDDRCGTGGGSCRSDSVGRRGAHGFPARAPASVAIWQGWSRRVAAIEAAAIAMVSVGAVAGEREAANEARGAGVPVRAAPVAGGGGVASVPDLSIGPMIALGVPGPGVIVVALSRRQHRSTALRRTLQPWRAGPCPDLYPRDPDPSCLACCRRLPRSSMSWSR